MSLSIRSRFGFSLFANFSKAAIAFGAGVATARGLGPEQYGIMMFLLSTFAALRQLLDMGSSSAFFTFLSQRQRTRRYIGWYSAWVAIQFLLPFFIIALVFPRTWIEVIWEGADRKLVVLSFVAYFLQSILWSLFIQLGEAQRQTQSVQGVGLCVTFAHFLFMTLAWWCHWLEIHTIFIAMIVEWSIAAAVMIRLLHVPSLSDGADNPKVILSEFWQYCLPIIPYAWLSFFYEFIDRWLLQTYAGSVQQAYYSIAYQFGTIASIATVSIFNIFWKEIAEAHHQNNRDRVALLYKKVTRGFFFIAAVVAGYLIPWSEEILRFSLGSTYVGGAMTLALMFFYPLHQSMGQICGAMAYATCQISTYVMLGMVFMAASTIVSYLVLAKPDSVLPGLDMGSFGLAGKMVVMQIIQVNALAFYFSRSMRVKFDWLFQPMISIICVMSGFLAFSISRTMFDGGTEIWAAIVMSGFVYAMLMLALISFTPGLAGLNRDDLDSAFIMGQRFIRRFLN